MNKRLQAILNLIQQSGSLTPEEKKSLADAVKESDKEITITEFKLERTEKVKRTTAILLEETIAELEQKRKSVEAQNRELEIEGALEKVRSRSIAMRQSSELGDLSFELVKQVQALGIATWHCAFNIYDEGQESSTEWGSNGNGSYPIYKTPREGIFKRYYEVGQSGATLHVEVIEEDRCADHYAYLCTLPGVGDTLVKFRDSGTPFPKSQIDHVAYFKYGYLLFITFEPAPEAHDVFKRFAKVFEQTYTRFLDLQQAEAQTREAQIQLALERVRARTMAMQKSDELREVVATLYEQLSQLNFDSNACNIIIIDNKTNNQQYWVSGFMQKLYPESYNVPYFEHSYIDVQLQSWKQGEKYTVIEYSGKTKKEFDKQFFSQTEFKNIPQEVQEIIKSFESARLSTAFFTYGALQIIGPSSLSDENAEILQRFASVFDQTYTRFLDLQRAEAQAKEAKIEAGLERVRSRAMAMQTSEELNALIGTVFTELTKLDLVLTRCVIMTYDQKTNDARWWMTNSEAPEKPMNLNVPYNEHPPNLAYFSAWRERRVKWIYPLEGTTKKEWDDFLFSETELRLLPDFVIAGMRAPDRVYLNASFYTSGNLTLASLEPLSDEHFDILIRFAKVFDLTYTRFNDLKQAEAQAWESKIEAALEKVRSRSLAMHKSEEVGFVVDELFLRMKDLEIGFDSVNILEFTEDAFQIWAAYQPGKFTVTKIPFTKSDIPYVRSAVEAKNRGKQLFAHQYAFEEKNVFLKYLFEETHFKNLPEERKQFLLQCPCYTVSIAFAKNTAIQLQSYSRDAFSESENTLLKRFVNVFEQAYTRFLDLQRAEAQARESQVEAALERVRSRTMAMQKSDELTDVAGLLFKQVTDMGIKTWTAGFNVWSEDNNSYVDYITSPSGGFIEPYTIDSTQASLLTEVSDARKSGVEFFVQYAEGERLKEAYLALSKFGDQKQYEIMLQGGFQFPSHQYDHFVFGSKVSLMFITYDSVPEAHDIFKRFGKVFEQTYTRFLDLQKAEAQAREAQIEAALERVRSRTMAMQKSDELSDTASLLFKQVTDLGIKSWTAGFNVWSDDNNSYVDYVTNPNGGFTASYTVKTDEAELLTEISEARKSGQEFFVQYGEGEKLKELYRALLRFDKKQLEKLLEDGFPFPSQQYNHFVFGSKVSLMFITYDSVPEAHDIFKRFGKVFEQTYTRFLDLQKAEAQAREAQIEAALERVRSRTMAMHRSEEIADILGKIFKELTLLDVNLNRVLIWIFNPDEKYISWWSANPEAESNAESYRVDYNEHPVFLTYYEGWQKKLPLLLYTLGGDEKNSWEDHLFKNTELSKLPKAVQDGMRSEKQIFTTSAISEFGLMMAGCFEPFSDEINDIIQRFGRVFQQSYTRYMDVQKAEAQAREATIEASLEKVRGKAMGMHNSNDLVSTASLVFTELRKLGIDSFRNGVGLLTKENRNVKLYSATSSEEGGSFSVVGWAVLDHHPVLSKTYDSWVNNEDYFPALKGETLKSYYDKIAATFTVPVEQSEGYEQHGYFLPFSEGLFYGWSEKPFTETEIKILNRFRGIVDLTFRRYMELQKSEATAKEAIRQASLDRVRAEIASMRTTTDLDRITPLIWKELGILSIPFVRCGVFIMDELQQQIHTFLSTPEGKAIGAFHLPYDVPGKIGEILAHWTSKQMYVNHWDEADFGEMGEILVQQKAIPTKAIYMSTVPPGGIHLHCLPFMQGMLYVGNTTELREDDIHLIQSVADAFATAYARYEDFNKLESAKDQIEKTLTDLKQTQNQLVQSEKMASLGELTAGIAHEIQNPLNFINNFSEVNKELLAEMGEEIEKGNFDEVKAIVKHIVGNEEKINHHGKRADGIVKGMLQHSRTSSGVKEPTDINVLAEEYLRLAYHGLRAKDKSFNASMKTDFDKTIGTINIIPQDIGRVILNLISNAFYAVTEKKKENGEGHQPTVHVSTRKEGDKVLISVKDNGNGIPKKVLDKIFQPFFTTKPTGQGTGLGLSLSYDIVKAHGGEIRVETKDGEGAEFILELLYI